MSKKGLTYAQAGVDIDAGNRMVELIKPLVRATRAARRRRRDRRLRRPVRPQARRLQRSGAGRRHRRRRHQGQDRDRDRPARHDRHRSRRHVGQRPRRAGRRAAVLPRLFRHAASSIPKIGAAVVKGIADGCRQAGCALIGGETAEMPGLYHGERLRPRRLCGRRRRARRDAAARRHRAGDVVLGLASSGVHSNGYSLVRKVVEQAKLELERARAVRPEADARRGAARRRPAST